MDVKSIMAVANTKNLLKDFCVIIFYTKMTASEAISCYDVLFLLIL